MKENKGNQKERKETDKGSKGHCPKRTGRNDDRQRAERAGIFVF